MAEARALVLNDVLCFLLCKYGSVPVKLLKTALLDFYNADVISEAKVCLLDSITDLQLAVRSPHVSRRRDGNDRITREVDDIFLLISHIDEQKAFELLPKFVCSGPDNVPSLRVYEGDLKVMLNMIGKLGDQVTAMGSTLAAIVHDVRELQAKVSAPEPFPTLQQARSVGNNAYAAALTRPPPVPPGAARATVSASSSQSLNVPRSQSDLSHRPSTSINCSGRSTLANPILRPSIGQPGRSDRWADLSDQEQRQSATDREDDASEYELVTSRRNRKRMRQQSAEQQQRAGDASRPLPSTVGRVGVSGSHSTPSAQSRSTRNALGGQQPRSTRSSRRQPLVVGKSMDSSTIQAARPFKSVFCVDNVSLSFNENQLAEFVTRLGVRVFSCHEVKPRMSYFQRNNFGMADHRTFRLCINKVDKDLLLNADVLPADITISNWHFKGKPSEADDAFAHSDDNVVSESETVVKSVARDDLHVSPEEAVPLGTAAADPNVSCDNTASVHDESIAIVDMDDTLMASPRSPGATGIPDL